MLSPLRFKLTLIFFLLFIVIAGLFGSTRLTTYAATSSLKSSAKLKEISTSSVVNCGGWNVIASPNVLTGNNVLYGVAAISANNVWAVGYYTDIYSNQNYDETLIEHWDGIGWNVIPSPNPGPGGNIFNGIAEVNAKNIWAVGASWDSSGNTVQSLIEHWNGANWKVVSSPIAHEQLTSITRVPGTNQLWAVGLGGLIEHWDGANWSIVTSPNGGLLKSVVAISASDVWAVGQYASNSYQALIEHWDGIGWNIVTSPNVGTDNSTLYGITRFPGTNKILSVGYHVPLTGSSQTLTERWNGTNWGVVPSPNAGSNNNFFNGVTAISTHNAWAVGGFVNDPISNMPQALIEHWNGANWSVISSPSTGENNSFLEAVIRVPSANQLWAVGTIIDSNNLYQTLTEFYC